MSFVDQIEARIEGGPDLSANAAYVESCYPHWSEFADEEGRLPGDFVTDFALHCPWGAMYMLGQMIDELPERLTKADDVLALIDWPPGELETFLKVVDKETNPWEKL